ncbi:MAG: hypothetical protein ABI591_34345 [Kofleriaceae bacterium]
METANRSWREIVRAYVVAGHDETDQFSAAAALYQALYGKPPVELPAKPPNPAVPIVVHRAIVRALAVDPANRWPSTGDLVDALDLALRPRSTKWFIAFALVVTAAVVGGVVIAHELKKPPPAQVR